MLRSRELGEVEAGIAIEDVVADITANKLENLSAGRMGYSTSEVGDLVSTGLA